MHRSGDPRDVVVGWRAWKLSRSGLRSWAVEYIWRPGSNRATCHRSGNLLVTPSSCTSSPGHGCLCGLWALWDLAGCVDRVRGAVDGWLGAAPVIGLVAGWGEVAIHGDEGFRAQHASVLLLIEDSVWAEALDPLWSGRPGLARVARRLQGPVQNRRRRLLREVAGRYGVPVLGLAQAIRSGLLEEFGARVRRIREVESPMRDR